MIREVLDNDVDDILEIYAPIVSDSHWSFEIEVPSRKEFQDRIALISNGYPFIVLERAGRVMGYAYATRLRQRAAYNPSVETSIYMHTAVHGKGEGRRLYSKLLSIIQLAGYSQCYAGATLPNEVSAAFHEKMGFTRVGTWPKVGYKFDKWWDVGWWHKEIHPTAEDPLNIIEYGHLRTDPRFLKILEGA